MTISIIDKRTFHQEFKEMQELDVYIPLATFIYLCDEKSLLDSLKQHFKQIEEAIDDGVDVIGYIMWGVIDIVSAGSCEMAKRYGVIYVDGDNLGNGTYKRYKKDSFKWYHDYIQAQHQQFKK